MPKDRRSSSVDRCRTSPYARCYNNNKRARSPALPIGNENEWEETKCPICMEHPHNAVLLLCSSREKGCLPYMCDTSARHSNCLDQFRKSTMNTDAPEDRNKLVCPLCRGKINGWIVVRSARQFMNNKPRSCSSGTCDFSGNYSQLRMHARREHPCVRPTDVDPDQELEWRNLEEDMEQQDMLSMQFEFDDDDDMGMENLRDGGYELANPIWDYDMDFLHFLTTFETEFDSVFPEIDWDSGDNDIFSDEWENILDFSSSHEVESRESGRSRGTNRTHNRLSSRPRENAPTTRSRTSTNRRQRVSTLLDFHDLSSNLP